MKYNRKIHHRRSIRLKGYDYSSPGSYFVTICAQNRDCIFGEINNEKMVLNEYGKTVEFTWYDLLNHVANIELDEFIVMPNHFHGIINIIVGAGSEPAPTDNRNQHGLSEIIRQLKTFTSKRVNTIRQTPYVSVWQRNYHDRIIRDERELSCIQEYIINNPLKWKEDNNNPANFSVDGNGPVNKITDEGWNL